MKDNVKLGNCAVFMEMIILLVAVMTLITTHLLHLNMTSAIGDIGDNNNNASAPNLEEEDDVTQDDNIHQQRPGRSIGRCQKLFINVNNDYD